MLIKTGYSRSNNFHARQIQFQRLFIRPYLSVAFLPILNRGIPGYMYRAEAVVDFPLTFISKRNFLSASLFCFISILYFWRKCVGTAFYCSGFLGLWRPFTRDQKRSTPKWKLFGNSSAIHWNIAKCMAPTGFRLKAPNQLWRFTSS